MNVYTITGATGYIGHKLIEKLVEDEKNFVYAVIRSSSSIKLHKENIEYIIYVT